MVSLPYKKCFVACLDILGFKNFIHKRASIDGDDASFVYDSLKKINKLSEIIAGVRRGNPDPKIYSILLSDTILLFSEKDDRKSFKYIVGIVAETICDGIGLSISNIATSSTPMRFRGAISYGNFYYDSDKKIFFGPAYNDAAKWEKKQEWIGAILTPDCAEFIQNKGINIDSIIEYEVPIKEMIIKDGKCENRIISPKCLCVNWTNGFACKDSNNDELFKGQDKDEEYKEKLKYTRDFYNYCKSEKHSK